MSAEFNKPALARQGRSQALEHQGRSPQNSMPRARGPASALWIACTGLAFLSPSAGAQENRTAASVKPSAPTDHSPTTNAVGRLSYSSFALINERNIFDPSRSSGRTRPGQSAKKVKTDTFSLVGTMSYEKGDFAFFDGSKAEFKQALKVDDAIAGYTIASITVEGVTLEASGQKLRLAVGNQLRREEDGPWELSTSSPASDTATEVKSEDSETSSSGGSSDVLERLLKKRQQELKDEKP